MPPTLQAQLAQSTLWCRWTETSECTSGFTKNWIGKQCRHSSAERLLWDALEGDYDYGVLKKQKQWLIYTMITDAEQERLKVVLVKTPALVSFTCLKPWNPEMATPASLQDTSSLTSDDSARPTHVDCEHLQHVGIVEIFFPCLQAKMRDILPPTAGCPISTGHV